MSRNKRKAALAGKRTENFSELAAEYGGRLSGFEQVAEAERRLAEKSRAIGTDPNEIARLASICTRCGESGHRSKVCPTIICNLCGVGGHKARQCPTKANS